MDLKGLWGCELHLPASSSQILRDLRRETSRRMASTCQIIGGDLKSPRMGQPEKKATGVSAATHATISTRQFDPRKSQKSAPVEEVPGVGLGHCLEEETQNVASPAGIAPGLLVYHGILACEAPIPSPADQKQLGECSDLQRLLPAFCSDRDSGATARGQQS